MNSPDFNSYKCSSTLRIALTIHSLQGGGAERLMAQLANHWARNHEVHLLTWSVPETDLYHLNANIRRHGLAMQKKSGNPIRGMIANVQRVKILRAELLKICPDIVVSFCDQMNIVCLEAARKIPKVPVWIAEQSDPLQQRLGTLWEAWRRRTYPRCSGGIVLTEETRQVMARWVPIDRIHVIPPALSEASGFDSEYSENSQDGCNIITFLGRLSPEKQVDLLLRSWDQVQRNLPKWSLQIVGDGPERERLERIAKGISRVRFVGWTQSPQEFLRRSQVFALCSRYEGFPIALLEALSFGLPSIVTRCSNSIAVLQENGGPAALRVIESSSMNELVSALLEVCESAELRRRMSQQAKKLAEQYRWQKIAPLWDSLLKY